MKRTLLGVAIAPLILWGGTLEETIDAIGSFDQPKLQTLVNDSREANLSLSNKKTLLMWAAFKGNLIAVEYLLTKGADLNAQDEEGKTALMLSLWNNFDDVALSLLQQGANPQLKSQDGVTALRIAQLYKNQKMENVLKKWGAKE